MTATTSRLKKAVAYWFFVVFVLAILVVGTWLPYWGPDWWTRLPAWAGDVAPEFLSAAVLGLIADRYLRWDARRKYIRTMRTMRAGVKAQSLDPKQAQGLMETVVPQVSLLYFGTERPKTRTSVVVRDHCATCRSPEEIVDGACERCGDIEESWADYLVKTQ
jgi:hypothetical protein